MASKMAIIGLGIMGRRMLDNVMTHPVFEVCGVWDPSEHAIAKARELAPEVHVASSAEAAMTGADVVYLACPPGPRKAYALQAGATGQGVFMEKPLGTDNAESTDLAARLSSTRLKPVVNFTQASSIGFDKLREAIAKQETGELIGIDIVVNYPAWPRAWQIEADWLRFRDEGGYTREVISHFLFLASRFLGPLHLQTACPRYPSDASLCELDMLARLKSDRGQVVNVIGTTGGQQPDRQEVTVKGTKRSYQFREFYQLWQSDGGPWTETIDWSKGEDPRRSALQRQLTELDNWLHGRNHKLATIDEALAVQTLVEGMLVGRP
ncbi:MAG: Gfo/Idh/MocA family protein [Burkholderiaceae bacterium]